MYGKTKNYVTLIVHPLFVLLLLMIIFHPGEAHAQTFNLGEREYRLIEGKWYNFSSGQKGDQIIPERLMLRLKDRGDLRGFDFSQLGLTNITVTSDRLFGGFYVVEVNPPQDPFNVASVFSKSPVFDYVEFDAIGKFNKTPEDPLYANQWNLPKISMPSAWEFEAGSNSIVLAIIDTGTDYDHKDIDGNIWVNSEEDYNGNGQPDFYPYYGGGDLDYSDNDNNGYIDDLIGWDFYSSPGDNDPFPVPEYFNDKAYPHGTAVTGIAAAQTNNYEYGSYRGIAGIAGGWGTKRGVALMILKYHYRSDGPYASTTAQCIRYAARNGAKVINISSGWYDNYTPLQHAVDSAVNVYDCVIAASVGNYKIRRVNFHKISCSIQ